MPTTIETLTQQSFADWHVAVRVDGEDGRLTVNLGGPAGELEVSEPTARQLDRQLDQIWNALEAARIAIDPLCGDRAASDDES
jgi:hypothetical protein